LSSSATTRQILLALKAELISLREAADLDRKPVELDQQSVGRLSRMDSIQVQAMANAAEARRATEIRRIDAALIRVEDDEYGWCVACGDAIEPKRLDVDPAAPRCAECA
jgi:DnaK suppressor protein